MTDNIELLRSYITRLGIEPKIADVYQALQTYGAQTMSELARSSGVDRIQIYRLLDELKKSGLVEIDIHYKRTILRAAPITTLQILLSKREQDLKDLETEYTALATTFSTQTMESDSTRVQFYQGVDGIKQMLWNETKGTTENLSILHESLQNRTGLAFFERWIERLNVNDVHCRSVVGDHFIQKQNEWYEKHETERLQHWEARRITDTIFPIEHSTVIYDDTVAYYNWKNGRVFGVEVHNQEIADSQRYFFESLWNQAESLDRQ